MTKRGRSLATRMGTKNGVKRHFSSSCAVVDFLFCLFRHHYFFLDARSKNSRRIPLFSYAMFPVEPRNSIRNDVYRCNKMKVRSPASSKEGPWGEKLLRGGTCRISPPAELASGRVHAERPDGEVSYPGHVPEGGNEPDGLIPQIDIPHDPQGETQILFII